VASLFARPLIGDGPAAIVVTAILWTLGAGPLVVAGLLVERSGARRTYWDRASGTRVVYQRA
jgi:hypothetical protein